MEAEAKESRLSRFLARRWAVPGVIAGAVAIVALACLTPDLIAKWQLARERDAIRARGEPVTLAGLAPEMPPEGENAAVLLTMALPTEPPEFYNFYCEAGEELHKGYAKHRAGAEKALALSKQAMRTVRSALSRPRCVFDLDFTKGVALALPHLAKMRSFARLFKAEAIIYALDGKGPEAAGSIRQVLLLARALNEEPLFISKLVAIAIAGIGMTALEEVEVMSEIGAEERRLIVMGIASLNFEKSATEAFIAERAFASNWSDVAAAMPAAPGTPRKGWLSRWLAGRSSRMSPREKLRAMRLWTLIIEASRLPPWEGRPVIEEHYRELCPLLPWNQATLSIDDEPWKRFYTVFMRPMASRDTTILGLSCELFRSAKGRYPATLDELAPEFLDRLPPDPFTGKPFRYQLRDGGRAFIVYSVGDDLKDDGGVEKRAEGNYDISWEGRAAKD